MTQRDTMADMNSTEPLSVSEVTGELAARARYCARTATEQKHLRFLAAAYTAHVSYAANAPAPRCPHVTRPPYIILVLMEDRAFCIECVKDVLPPDGTVCAEDGCNGRARIYMFPFGDIVAAGALCQECGGPPLLAATAADGL